MTKGTLIDSILLAVNGGKLTSDTKVRREDVEVLLSSAINFSIVGQYRLDKKETGDSEFSESFIATYPDVEVKEDTARGLRYIDLPSGILALPKNYGLQSVSPMKGTAEFIQINFNDRQHNAYYTNTFAGYTLFWLEGQKVYFQNLPDITDKVLVRTIDSINDLDDDDELPIAAGLEIDVLNLMREWFSGQRAAPADMKPDNRDVIDAQK